MLRLFRNKKNEQFHQNWDSSKFILVLIPLFLFLKRPFKVNFMTSLILNCQKFIRMRMDQFWAVLKWIRTVFAIILKADQFLSFSRRDNTMFLSMKKILRGSKWIDRKWIKMILANRLSISVSPIESFCHQKSGLLKSTSSGVIEPKGPVPESRISGHVRSWDHKILLVLNIHGFTTTTYTWDNDLGSIFDRSDFHFDQLEIRFFSFKLSFILYNHVNLSFAVRSKWLLVKVQSGRLQNLPPDHHVTNHLTTYHMTQSARIRRLQTTSLLGIDNKGYKAKMKLGRTY